MNKKLYLDDLYEGQRFSCGSIVLNEKNLIGFAEQYDPQSFHVDKEAAKKSVFKGLAASGWHTAALTNKLVVENGPPIANGFIGMGLDINWMIPVRAGDTLYVDVEIVKMHFSQTKPDRGVVTIKITTKNQKEEVVQIINSNLLVMKKLIIAE